MSDRIQAAATPPEKRIIRCLRSHRVDGMASQYPFPSTTDGIEWDGNRANNGIGSMANQPTYQPCHGDNCLPRVSVDWLTC